MVPLTSSTADGSKEDGGQVTSGNTSRVVPKRKLFKTGGPKLSLENSRGGQARSKGEGIHPRDFWAGQGGGPWPGRS